MALNLHRKELVMKYFFAFFLLAWPLSLWAPPRQQVQQRTQTQQRQQVQQQTQTQTNQPSGAFYNEIQQQQFAIKVLTNNLEKAENGCMGDGGSSGFFAGGYDEAYSYWKVLGREAQALRQCGTASVPPADQGTYQFIQIEDRCRTLGGCGTLATDNRSCILGLPQYATNVVSWGQKRICDEASCENPPPFSNSNDPHWQNRNFIPNFLYGRYLLQCSNWNITPNTLVGSSMSLHFYSGRSNTSIYSSDILSPNFFDCSYTPRGIVDGGFTCSQIAAVDGYKANPNVAGVRGYQGGSSFEPLEEERRILYRSLIESATNSLGQSIAQGNFGNAYAGSPSTAQKEEKEIVVNAFAILNEMGPNLEGADCTSRWCRVARAARNAMGGNLITLQRGPVPDGAFLHYDHENSRIILRPDVGRDCMSKRPAGAHPHYNVQSCDASYGTKTNAGIFDETPFQNPGYELYAGQSVRDRNVDVVLGRARESSQSADGYACEPAGKIAHQLVHAYFRKTLNKNRMALWPNPESLWEEELAVSTEALVVDQLADLGYCPKGQELRKENFIRSITTSQNTATPFVTASTMGSRFYYTQPPKGLSGISLEPYYNNLFNIVRHLKAQRPEDARTTALEVAMCPNFNPPPNMCVDGTCGSFALPQPQGGGTQIIQQTQQQQIQQSVQQRQQNMQRTGQ